LPRDAGDAEKLLRLVIAHANEVEEQFFAGRPLDGAVVVEAASLEALGPEDTSGGRYGKDEQYGSKLTSPH
jgi:hypothetical protein